jgi:hypothetical protein
MKKVLVLGVLILLLSPVLLTAQATPANAPAAAGRGGGGRAGGAPAAQPPANLQSKGGGTCANNTAPDGQAPRWEVVQKWNCAGEPNPLPPINSVWLKT